MNRILLWALGFPLWLAASAQAAGVMTDAVTASQNVDNPTNAVGLPATTDFGTDTTPFTPPFSSIAVLGNTTDSTTNTAAASITLHFASPVVPGAGREIGVFTNVGLTAAFDPGTEIITAATGPQLFSSIPQKAIVSVSSDNNTYIALNGGAPMDLSMVSDAFTDSKLVYHTDFFYVDATGGSAATDPFKPFTGSLSDFTGETYPQMLTTLNGSSGGKWIDVSSSGLSQVNYVRFDVPQGATYRLVLDAVTAVSAAATVPEPASLGLLGLGVALLAARRRR